MFEEKIIVVRLKEIVGKTIWKQLRTGVLWHVTVEQLRSGNQSSQLIRGCAVIANLPMFVSIGYENKAGRTTTSWISKHA